MENENTKKIPRTFTINLSEKMRLWVEDYAARLSAKEFRPVSKHEIMCKALAKLKNHDDKMQYKARKRAAECQALEGAADDNE